MQRRRWRAAAARAAARNPWLAALATRVARRLAAPQRVGVVAVVPDGAGRVLVVRHAFRDPRWALPGGWVGSHEQPADAIVRELREELGLAVEPVAVLGAESHRVGVRPRFPTPSAMTISYGCAPVTAAAAETALARRGGEVREVAWLAPEAAFAELTPFDAASVRAALGR